MSNWNGKRFSIYTSDEKSALGLIEELGNQTNDNTDKLANKTDLHGDHKGSWCGLYPPTLSEEGMRATVEKHEKDIEDINSSLETNTNHINSIRINSKFPPIGFNSLKENTDVSDDLNALLSFCMRNKYILELEPNKVFIISKSISFGNYAILDGNNSTLKLSNNSDITKMIVGIEQLNRIKIKNLELHGNKVNNNIVCNGIEFNRSGLGGDNFIELENLRVHDFKGDGVVFSSGNREIRVDNCESYFNEGVGFNFDCTDSVVSRCTSFQNRKNGFLCSSVETKYISCKAFGNGINRANPADTVKYSGFKFFAFANSNPRLFNVSGCSSQENGKHGFEIDTVKYGVFTNLTADANGITYDTQNLPSADFQYSGISIANSEGIIVNGQCSDFRKKNFGAKTQKYGLSTVNSKDCNINIVCTDMEKEDYLNISNATQFHNCIDMSEIYLNGKKCGSWKIPYNLTSSTTTYTLAKFDNFNEHNSFVLLNLDIITGEGSMYKSVVQVKWDKNNQQFNNIINTNKLIKTIETDLAFDSNNLYTTVEDGKVLLKYDVKTSYRYCEIKTISVMCQIGSRFNPITL